MAGCRRRPGGARPGWADGSRCSGRNQAASHDCGCERLAMPRRANFWIPVICGGMILTIGIGARQSFGIFQKPIAADLNVGRELWSFGTAAAGFGPIFGAIARQTPPERRSVALGVATAGGSFGQFAIVPLASILQSR